MCSRSAKNPSSRRRLEEGGAAELVASRSRCGASLPSRPILSPENTPEKNVAWERSVVRACLRRFGWLERRAIAGTRLRSPRSAHRTVRLAVGERQTIAIRVASQDLFEAGEDQPDASQCE